VLDAGFEAPPARPPDIKTARAVLGAFDAPSAAAQPGTDRSTGFVAAAGFGGAPPPPRSTAARAAVGDAGFGAPESARPQSQKPTTIQTGEFAETRAPQVPAAPVKPRPERVDRIDTPVEVLFKPSPEYTDEARALKIEGEVVLEVEFCANRELRVLRVVRGLGHGLDESAVRAAKGIRFTPAQSDGRAVAFRATVNIIFRLT
jgi:TonB family protein